MTGNEKKQGGISRILELQFALLKAKEALRELSKHPAFSDNAPEFNKGGVGYEAIRIIDRTIFTVPPKINDPQETTND